MCWVLLLRLYRLRFGNAQSDDLFFLLLWWCLHQTYRIYPLHISDAMCTASWATQTANWAGSSVNRSALENPKMCTAELQSTALVAWGGWGAPEGAAPSWPRQQAPFLPGHRAAGWPCPEGKQQCVYALGAAPECYNSLGTKSTLF